MRKKQHMHQKQSDGTNIHIVGQERFICVQNYVGDLPSGEPNDWLPQYDEYERLLEYELTGYDPSEANELLEDKWLVDEYQTSATHGNNS